MFVNFCMRLVLVFSQLKSYLYFSCFQNGQSILPAFNSSCKEMLEEWEKLASPKGTVELDAWTYCHDLARNMLARASFGDFYKDGINIFQIHQEQIDLSLQTIRSVYIPGSKYVKFDFNIF